MKNDIYRQFVKIWEDKGAGFILLLDPDRRSVSEITNQALQAQEQGVDVIFIGSSLIVDDTFEETVHSIKKQVTIPVILFPGSTKQVSRSADAILFLSLISGRNPYYLIGDQVVAAPMVRKYGLEAISCGYMLIDSGKSTSASFMSNTTPIPDDKPDIAAAHALAAEYLGMKTIYLEAGSGAERPVPNEMIRACRNCVEIPILVGGGIRSPEVASQKVQAGASFIVIGNVLEKPGREKLVEEFAAAIHSR